MPRSIRQFIIMVVAIGLAVVGATAIGTAQSAFEQAKKTTYRINSPVSETDFRIGPHQQLRNIFFGGDRLR